MKYNYYITGLGILSAYGFDHDIFYKNILNNHLTFKEKTVNDEIFKVNQLDNFDPALILGEKGIRLYNTEAKLAISAFELAINDSNKNFSELGDDTGIFYQAILPVKSNYDFNYDRIYEGGAYVNPAQFPLILPNSIPGYAAIRKGFKGINNTICLGEASLGYCLESAIDEMNNQSIKYAFIGAANDLCDEFLLILSKLGKTNNVNSYLLSENAGFILLEKDDTIIKNQSKVYCKIASFDNGFDSNILNGKVNHIIIQKIINKVLNDANLTIDDIDLIIPDISENETTRKSIFLGLKNLLSSKESYICNTKKFIGESFTVSQLNNIFVASGIFKDKIIPASSIINFNKINDFNEINYTTNSINKINNILMITMNCFGHINAIIIQRPDL